MMGLMMADLGQLLGVGVEVRGLGMGYLGRVDYATVVSQRSRGSVVGVMLGFWVMIGDRSVVGDLVVTVISKNWSVMRGLGELFVVGVEVSGFGVGHLGGVDDATVMGQRGEGSVVRLEGVHVGSMIVTRSRKDRHCEG